MVAGFGVLNLCGCAGKADEPKKDESSFKADFELGELRLLDAIDYGELTDASRGVSSSAGGPPTFCRRASRRFSRHFGSLFTDGLWIYFGARLPRLC